MRLNRPISFAFFLLAITSCTNIRVASNKDAALTRKMTHLVIQYNAFSLRDSSGYHAALHMKAQLAKKGIETRVVFRSALALETVDAWKARAEAETQQYRMEISWLLPPDQRTNRQPEYGTIDLMVFEKGEPKPVWRAAVEMSGATSLQYIKNAQKLGSSVVKKLKDDGVL